MENSAAHLVMRVRLNEKPTSFVVETGGERTAVDRSSLRKFQLSERTTNLPLKTTLGRGREYVGITNINKLHVGNINLTGFQAAVIDASVLHHSLPTPTAEIDGVFGLLQMRTLSAVIDCGQRNLYLHPSGAGSAPSATLERLLAGRGFVKIPMRINSNRLPEVDCRVNGHPAKIVVETAAFKSVIDKRLAVGSGPAQNYSRLVIEAVGQRKAPFTVAKLRDLSVGGVHDQGTSVIVSDVAFNVLGLDFLSAKEAIIDTGNMNLFLH